MRRRQIGLSAVVIVSRILPSMSTSTVNVTHLQTKHVNLRSTVSNNQLAGYQVIYFPFHQFNTYFIKSSRVWKSAFLKQ